MPKDDSKHLLPSVTHILFLSNKHSLSAINFARRFTSTLGEDKALFFATNEPELCSACLFSYILHVPREEHGSTASKEKTLRLATSSLEPEDIAISKDLICLMNVSVACRSDGGRRRGLTKALRLGIRNFSLQISLNSADCRRSSGQ